MREWSGAVDVLAVMVAKRSAFRLTQAAMVFTYRCHGGAAASSCGQDFCYVCLCLNPERTRNYN